MGIAEGTIAIASIVLAITAIVLSIFFWRDSRQLADEASRAINLLKNNAEGLLKEIQSNSHAVRHDVEDITSELIRSVLNSKESGGVEKRERVPKQRSYCDRKEGAAGGDNLCLCSYNGL